MPTQIIESYDDPLLEPYRQLKERELARTGGRFIAEGENVVRRLLKSQYPAESVLISHRKRQAIEPLVPQNIPTLVADDAIIKHVLSFKFHSGVIACGLRQPSPSLESIVPPVDAPALFMVCQDIANSENMGALIRISAAFGVTAIIVGERCTDPFFRRSIRVSMGTIFSLPLVRSENLLKDLDLLRGKWGIQTVAAVLADDALSLRNLRRTPKMAIAFGSEAQGLDPQTLARCDHRVTIPMQLGTDSLNVAVAAAVFLYHLTLE